MPRTTGLYVDRTLQGETVHAFIPHALPPAGPALASDICAARNQSAEVALSRLSAMSGLVPSVDWLLYSAVRREALLTSQLEGTQATLADLFDHEAGLDVENQDDVEEVANLSSMETAESGVC